MDGSIGRTIRTKGPTTEATPYIPPNIPWYTGRFSIGDEKAIMINAPENIPADPTPAIALCMWTISLLDGELHADGSYPYYQRRRVRSNSGDERAQFEKEESRHEGPFDIEDGIEFPEE